MLGIAAVVGLDLGFTVFIGSENPSSIALDSPIRNSGIVQPSQPSPDQVQPEATDESVVADLPAKPANAKRPRTISERSKTSTIDPKPIFVAAVFRPDRPALRSSRSQFAPTTAKPGSTTKLPLTFGPYVVTTSGNISYANAEVRRAKDNSLASKFSPLVKKPWHLMKSLVSKLR